MKIAYLVDSSVGLKEDPANDLYFVPLEIIETLSDGQEKRYRAELDIDITELGQKMTAGSKKFKTASSIPGEVQLKVETLLKTYDLVIGLPISKGISGTMQSWQLIAAEVGVDKFHVLDTNAVEYMTVYFYEAIREYLNTNAYERKKLNDFVLKLQKTIWGCLVVEDISQLRAGGRIKVFKAMLVRALHLKLIIDMSCATGELKFWNKARTHQDAKIALLDHLDEILKWRTKGIKRVTMVANFLDAKTTQEHYNQFKALLPSNVEFRLASLTSVVSVHTGVGVYALTMQTNS